MVPSVYNRQTLLDSHRKLVPSHDAHGALVHCIHTTRVGYMFSTSRQNPLMIANVRRYLSEAELWRAVRMGERWPSQLQVFKVLFVHHTVITKAWARFQQHGRPVWWYDGGRERSTTAAEDRIFIFQADRNCFATQSSFALTFSIRGQCFKAIEKTMYM